MDLEGYVVAHQDEWRQLELLVGRSRRLSGAEVDELVDLYQRVATHLSVVRSSAPDEFLVARLTTLVARARGLVTGAGNPAWQDLSRFFLVSLPAVLYRTKGWWLGVGTVFVLLSLALGSWVATRPGVRGQLIPPDTVRQLVDHDFANYYSENPAAEFAFGVWTHNALIAIASLVLGVFLGLPVLWMLWQNAVNIGIAGGVMAAYGKADVFFGLITPHGLLELTAVFVAAGAGLRLGWTVIHPGSRTRSHALAETGRATVGVALGLVVMLAISGVIEAFVTPSPLPTWARIGIGVLAEVGFLTYALILGRRAARTGETGDVTEETRGDALPVSG